MRLQRKGFSALLATAFSLLCSSCGDAPFQTANPSGTHAVSFSVSVSERGPKRWRFDFGGTGKVPEEDEVFLRRGETYYELPNWLWVGLEQEAHRHIVYGTEIHDGQAHMVITDVYYTYENVYEVAEGAYGLIVTDEDLSGYSLCWDETEICNIKEVRR